MGKAEWKPSKSWLPKRVSALLTLTRSTATPARRALTGCCASCGRGCPRPEWWCASAREWPSGASSSPCAAWGCSGSSCSLEGKALSMLSLPVLCLLSCRQAFDCRTVQLRLPVISIFNCLQHEKWQDGRAASQEGDMMTCASFISGDSFCWTKY